MSPEGEVLLPFGQSGGGLLDGLLQTSALLWLVGALLVVVVLLLRWFFGRLLANLDSRLGRFEGEVLRLDESLARVASDLPRNYHRRDDALREINLADERYQKAMEQVISVLRDDLVETKNRLDMIERGRSEDLRRFQARDDAIREYTTINAKLDRLYEITLEVRRDAR